MNKKNPFDQRLEVSLFSESVWDEAGVTFCRAD